MTHIVSHRAPVGVEICKSAKPKCDFDVTASLALTGIGFISAQSTVCVAVLLNSEL